MLKKLRLHLTLICMIITGAILLTITIMSLHLAETQLNQKNHVAFENHVSTIAYQLQFSQVITHSWLAQMEANNDLIISIEDNNHPLLFKGSWTPMTPRAKLLQKAKDESLNSYHLDSSSKPSSRLNMESVFFEIVGNSNDHYRSAVTIIPSHTGSYALILLQDMRSEMNDIFYSRIVFLSISLLGIICLGIFSWWFAGRAIVPIEINQQKQVAFIAAASHELKAPLAVIQSNASILEGMNHPTQHKFTNAIGQECSRMSRLVEDLLLLATADANTWSIHKSPIELDTLLIDLMDTFIPITHAKQQTLTLELPDEILAPIPGDKERIEQVITILISNATHYVPDGGTINLVLETSQHFATIKVIDNGPGIDPSHKPYIFNRFYRADKARKDKSHYGLGLSIAKEIVSLHSGSLSFKDSPGGGCTFIIKLPYIH